MVPPTAASNLLPIHRAFVVQLYATTDIDGGQVAGRVEHVVSGQATHFPSLDVLLAFITTILRREHPDAERPGAKPETGQGRDEV
jgi:hypothetical protein